MTATPPSSTAFAYVESDVPADQTLVQWRRERRPDRRAEARLRRSLRLPRIWRPRWAR